MPRTASHQRPAASKTRQDGLVVRMERAVPTMELPSPPGEQALPPEATLCTGRCGHCSVVPCQLHAQIGFRI